MTRAPVAAIAALLLAVVAGACGSTVIPVPTAVSMPAAALGFGDLQVTNGTPIPVTLVVDGAARIDVPAHGAGGVRAADLPPKPWAVSIRHGVSGRVLLALVVDREPVDDGVRQQGAGTRVDLSCGRIDVWVGPPMGGPVPAPGRPGDCDP